MNLHSGFFVFRIWAIAICLGLSALAMSVFASERPWGVNAHPYTYSSEKDTPAPRGYKAFYISHYGRHGSRSDLGSQYYPYLDSVLTARQATIGLTAQEDSLLRLTRRVNALYDGMDRRLLPLGQQEQAAIAKRMSARFPSVFKRGGEARAISSVIPRCILSMTAITNALSALHPNIKWYFDSGEQFQKYIYSTGPREMTVPAVQHWSDSVLNIDQITYEERCAYQTAVYAPLFGIPADPYYFLPAEKVKILEAEMTIHYCLNFGNTYYGRMHFPYSQVGLNEIIQRADNVIAGKENTILDLRFGHDNPILNLVSLMGIKGVGSPIAQEDISTQWPGWKYLCMGSNLQLIFYRNAANDVLVKVLYNEKECHIEGLTPIQNYYYRWADVRTAWLHTHRFATYNVRYVNPKNGDTGDKYWGNRRKYVIRHVLENKLDIVGMQEVTGNNRDSITGTSQLEDLCQGLKDYTCIAYERNDKKYSYNAIFYRTDKYECLSHSSFWLSETPQKASKSWGGTMYRRCIVAHMRDKNTQQEFWFANAHTDYSPLEAGLNQAKLLADTLPKIAGKLPIILVGDLNYNKMKNPEIYHIYRATMEDQPHPYTPTYQNWHTVRDTTYTGQEIDYLFYRQMRGLNWQVVTEDFGRSVPPSDHFPLYGDFQLIPKR